MDLFSGGFETLLSHWYDTMTSHVCKNFFSEIWQKEYFQEFSTYIKPFQMRSNLCTTRVMKLCQMAVNCPVIIVLYRNEFCETYILLNGHETCQITTYQIIMKHICMCTL